MGQENFEMDRGGAKKKSRLPMLAFSLLLAGSLAAMIALAVLYSQAQSEIEDLQAQAESTPATTSATEPPRPLIWRLAKDVEVSHYKIDLTVHLPVDNTEESLPEAFRTSGVVDISLRPIKSGVKEIQLHARTDPGKNTAYLSFQSSDVTLRHKGNEVSKSVEFQPETDIVIIKTQDELTPGNDFDYSIHIEYTGKIAEENDNQGLYRSSYPVSDPTNSNVTRRWLAATQFQPFKARRVFPCFDEPAFRAVYDISIRHDDRFKMVRTTGKNINRALDGEFNGHPYARTTFAPTPKMSAYLNAILIATDDFSSSSEKVPYNGEERDFAVISRDMASQNDARNFSLQQGVNMTQYLSGERFNQSLYEHLLKIDQAAVPDFNSGAMENWGLILYRESRLLWNDKVNSADEKRGVAEIVGHELAHFLFGNLVTCEFWDDTWLNEGFARHYQYELVKNSRPHWHVEDAFAYRVTQTAMKADSYVTSHPLFEPATKSFAEIENMFDTLTYAKGGTILQMFKAVMSENKYDEAIRAYLAKHKLGNVRHTDLLSAFNSASPADQLPERLEGWIIQSGYPVLKLIRTDTGLDYEQKRFLFVSNDTDASKTWHIPLTLKIKTGIDTTGFPTHGCWLNEQKGSVPEKCANIIKDLAENDWYLANHNQNGFYRVDYDEDNWNTIAAVLKKNHNEIDTVGRSQLLDDAFNLARTGEYRANYSIAVDLTKYLENERRFSPIASGFDNLRFVDSMLWGVSGGRAKMTDYMTKCIVTNNLYNVNYWDNALIDEDDDSNMEDVLYRSIVVENACYYGNVDCIQEAQKRLITWSHQGNFASNIPGITNVLNSVLCYGVRSSSSSDAQQADSNWRLLKDMLTPDLPTPNKLILIRALGCSANQEHLAELLEMSLNRTIVRTQDGDGPVVAATKFPDGLERAWNFVQINWDSLSRRASMISSLSSKFSSERQLRQLTSFHERLRSRSGDYPERITMEKAIDEVKTNFDWIRSYGTQVQQLLSCS